MVEGARLLSVCTSKGYRGFESLSLRHLPRARSSIGQSTRLRIWGLGVQIPPGAPDLAMSSDLQLSRYLRRIGQNVAAALLLSLLAASCASCSNKALSAGRTLSAGTPSPKAPLVAKTQQKLIEYQLAANAVRRGQECRETLLRERRAMMERSDGTVAQQEFVKKWGLQKFDPSTSFDDALVACVGEQKLTDLDIRPNETTINFLERKRREWEEAKEAEAAARSRSR